MRIKIKWLAIPSVIALFTIVGATALFNPMQVRATTPTQTFDQYINNIPGGTADYASWGCFPVAGVVSNLDVNVSSSDNGGAVTIYKNGSSTSLAVSSGIPGDYQDNTHTVSVAAGDYIGWHETNNNSTDNFSASCSVVFTPNDSISAPSPMFGTSTNLSTSATRYYQPGLDCNDRTAQTTEAAAHYTWGSGTGNLTYIEVYLSAAPGTNKSRTFTIYKNGSTTSLTVTISGSNTKAGASFSLSIANGDTISLQSVPTSTPAAATARWGVAFSLVQPPAAPTNVAATDGTYTDKVTITWTKSTGATGYKVKRDGSVVSGTLGDVSTYDDTGADAPVITAGSVVATDGTYTDKVSLSLSGTSVANGTTHTYIVVAIGTGGDSSDSSSDTGYRGHGTLTYQWKWCTTSGGSYTNFSGATSATYDDTTQALAGTITAGTASATDGSSISQVSLSISGQSANVGTTYYYKCDLTATGASNQTAASDSGYRGVGSLTYAWYKSSGDADSSFSAIGGATSSTYNDTAAPAPSITVGTITASDGTSNSQVTLTSSGASANAGAGRYYYCVLSATGATNQNTTHDRGYIGVGSLGYQWQVSAADSDASYSDIGGATTSTYGYTSAPAGIITAGTATASTSYADKVILTLTGSSGANGAGRYYKLVLSATGVTSVSPTTDRGYRGIGTLTYQWQRSASNSDASYSDIGGATGSPYNDIAAPVGAISVTTETFGGFGRDWVILKGVVGSASVGDTRYYLCNVSADGATSQASNHVSGNRAVAVAQQIGFDYGLTTSYGSEWTNAQALASGTEFVTTIRNLTAATQYHYRAKVYDGSTWQTGGDSYVVTQGSPVVYEYSNTMSNSGDSSHIYANNIVAEQFTAQATSHTVVTIYVWIKKVGSPTGYVYVDLRHADSGNNPTGISLATATFDCTALSAGYIKLPFVIYETSLQGGNKYAIQISCPTGDSSNYVLWQSNTAGDLANAVGLHSTDGVTWTSDTPADYHFEIWGNSCMRIVSALVTPNFITNGDLLFSFEYLNIYPPYYQTTDAKQYFTFRLLDTDGTTLIASVPMLNWGDKPGSIYLNPTLAASITDGGAYYIEIYGDGISGNPSSSYQLLATDWGGSITGWVIAVAHDMETYYSTPLGAVYFTQYNTATGGEILNSEGGAIFNPAIPQLNIVYPELFNINVVVPTYPVQTNPTVTVGDWTHGVGTTGATFLNDIGTMLGKNGKTVGVMFLVLMYGGIVVAGASKGRGIFAAAGGGIVFLMMGLPTLLIDWIPIIAFALPAAVFVIIGYWVTRT